MTAEIPKGKKKKKDEVIKYRSIADLYKAQLVMNGYTKEEVEKEMKEFNKHG